MTAKLLKSVMGMMN